MATETATNAPVGGVRLYEMANARDILDQMLEETEGELTPELEQLFEQLEGDINTKVERTALWIREKNAAADAIKAEEQRLAARRKAIENTVDRTKRYLEQQLERLGKDKVAGVLVTVALQNNPASVVLQREFDDHACRNLFMRSPAFVRVVPETYTLDKKAVLEAHKRKEALPDGITVEQSRSLRIR